MPAKDTHPVELHAGPLDGETMVGMDPAEINEYQSPCAIGYHTYRRTDRRTAGGAVVFAYAGVQQHCPHCDGTGRELARGRRRDFLACGGRGVRPARTG